MADREQHNGRMLFTDFDASDKGRPVPVFSSGPSGTAQAVQEAEPALSLDDLAASLGLAFEPDGDEAEVLQEPLQKKADAPAPVPASTPAPISAPAPAPDGEVVAAPSWDEMTRAYERATPVKNMVFSNGPSAPGAAPAPQAVSRAVSAAAPEADDSVDILSMLDEWLEHESRPLPPESLFRQPDAEAPGEAPGVPPGPVSRSTTRVVPPAPAVPYGGVKRIEDWFAPPENQPQEPQRVDDWFAPPEDQPEGVRRVTNWFEPPEAPVRTAAAASSPSAPEPEAEPDAGGKDETKVDISWLEPFQKETPKTGYEKQVTTRMIRKPARADAAVSAGADTGDDDDIAALFDGVPSGPADVRERPTPADTVALFAGMDFDRIWDRKIEEKRQPPSADSAVSGDGDTRRISSLFDSLDVEELWEKKQEEKRHDAPRDAAAQDTGAGDTLIVAPEKLAAEAAAGAGGSNSDQDEDIDILAELEETDPAPAAPAAPVAEETPAEEPEAAEAPAPSEDVSEEVSENIEDSAAPEVSEDSEDSEDFDEDPTGEEPAVNGSGGASMYGDGSGRSAGDGEEREYVARAHDPDAAPPPQKKGLTTDDLLDDIDLDALVDAAGDVSAPVIGDDAIEKISGEDGESDASGGSAEGEAPAAAVAVNPEDVFANMDDMDFSDDVDDDMRAMMEEDAEDETAEEGAEGGSAAASAAPVEAVPTTRLGKALYRANKLARRFLPMSIVDSISAMIAWRENWWFYCDLVAAVVASASLAVIISYWFWYRGN